MHIKLSLPSDGAEPERNRRKLEKIASLLRSGLPGIEVELVADNVPSVSPWSLLPKSDAMESSRPANDVQEALDPSSLAPVSRMFYWVGSEIAKEFGNPDRVYSIALKIFLLISFLGWIHFFYKILKNH